MSNGLHEEIAVDGREKVDEYLVKIHRGIEGLTIFEQKLFEAVSCANGEEKEQLRLGFAAFVAAYDILVE